MTTYPRVFGWVDAPVETTSELVVVGLAEMLADERLVHVGTGAELKAAGATDARPALFYSRLEPSPVAAVAVAVYSYDTTRGGRHNPDVYVQLRYRSGSRDPLAVDSMAARFSGRLDWAPGHPTEKWPNGTIVSQAERVVFGATDYDGTTYQRADSYRFTCNPPEIGSQA